MSHQEEIEETAEYYIENYMEVPILTSTHLRSAFLDGAETERVEILKMVDYYVDRMTRNIPSPCYDYKEDLRVAYLSIKDWLHNILDS